MNDSARSTPKESRKPEGELRRGWTTGACAAACAGAATRALLSGSFPDQASVRLPGGQTPCFDLSTCEITQNGARAGVIKDAGDDPDVTHGLEIIVDVSPGDIGTALTFKAGDGVGHVTLAGLVLAVGEPAINPGPRAMIADAVEAAIMGTQKNASRDLVITVSAPGGEEVAKKTMNGRLGIEGGISILGTTGIVVPFSCASWIHSIHRGIDVARELGLDHLLAATGRTSERAANEELKFSEQALIDMGDFCGGMLKYLRAHPVQHVTIAGGFAKMTKLAQGATDLHSSRSSVDVVALAQLLNELKAAPEQVARAHGAISAAQVLEIAGPLAPTLAATIARRAREVALATLAGGTEIEVRIYNREAKLLASSMDKAKGGS